MLTWFLLCFSLFTAHAELAPEQRLIVLNSYRLEREGKITQAITSLKAVYEKQPEDYFLNMRLGWLYSLDKKTKEAIASYGKAQKLNPKSIEPASALMSMHAFNGESDKVILLGKENLKKDPNHYLTGQRLVTALIKQKTFTEALEIASQFTGLYPLDPTFLEQVGYAAEQLGKNDRAGDAYSVLLLVNPDNVAARSYFINH